MCSADGWAWGMGNSFTDSRCSGWTFSHSAYCGTVCSAEVITCGWFGRCSRHTNSRGVYRFSSLRTVCAEPRKAIKAASTARHACSSSLPSACSRTSTISRWHSPPSISCSDEMSSSRSARYLTGKKRAHSRLRLRHPAPRQASSTKNSSKRTR